jgi:2-polyprenyl-6-methoxyphenol hydroxylase-like FAD-dependent oxidoreductase
MPGKKVLISGIGIAGPTLAYWLGRNGFEVTLVEAAPHLRTRGYVIDFWGTGYNVAERMGLVPALERTGYKVKELRLVNSEGKRVGGFDVDVFRRLTDGRYVSLPRGDLAALIYDLIKDRHEAMFGDQITAIEQTETCVEVAFEHSPPRAFDVVIGADGLHSEVRRLVFGPQERFETYLGYAVAAFEARGYRPRDEDVYVSYSVPGKQIARFAMRDDSTLFLFVFRKQAPLAPDALDLAAKKQILHVEFSSAGWECKQILAALDQTDDLYFDRVSQIRMDAWSRGRVGLLGDAAFCVSLLAGQGSALAMAGAYILAGEMAREDAAPEGAFARTHDILRDFIAGKQKAAEDFASSFAPSTWAGITFRNVLTRTFKIPFVANLVLGPMLLDRLTLPDYPHETHQKSA